MAGHPGIDELTEKERETLRLLLVGHDAKSIAREFELSVHTINDRLKDARRKLGVSSSKEAARILAQAEGMTPENFGGQDLGIAPEPLSSPGPEHRDTHRTVRVPLVWIVGGILVMIAVIALALTTLSPSSAPQLGKVTQASASSAVSSPAAAPAKAWTEMLDKQQWAESWSASGSYFQSQITAAQWAKTAKSVREPLGTISSRTLVQQTRATELPGAPAGDYEILAFRSDFSKRSGVVETVILVKEAGSWRVVGYFVR